MVVNASSGSLEIDSRTMVDRLRRKIYCSPWCCTVVADSKELAMLLKTNADPVEEL